MSSCIDKQEAERARQNLVLDTALAQELGAQMFNYLIIIGREVLSPLNSTGFVQIAIKEAGF